MDTNTCGILREQHIVFRQNVNLFEQLWYLNFLKLFKMIKKIHKNWSPTSYLEDLLDDELNSSWVAGIPMHSSETLDSSRPYNMENFEDGESEAVCLPFENESVSDHRRNI